MVLFMKGISMTIYDKKKKKRNGEHGNCKEVIHGDFRVLIPPLSLINCWKWGESCGAPSGMNLGKGEWKVKM